MKKEDIQTTTETNKTPPTEGAPTVAPTETKSRFFSRNQRSPKRRSDRGERARPRSESEFEERVIDIRRVARVVAGGRRFSFLVVSVLGDKKGRVGVGTGKGRDTTLAIAKASRDAKKNMITVKFGKDFSIPSQSSAKYNSARVLVKPSSGSKVIAGSAVRTVLLLCGVRGVSAKILSRSKNKLNNARATIIALKKFS